MRILIHQSNPNYPNYVIRHMAQFTTDYLLELAAECRKEVAQGHRLGRDTRRVRGRLLAIVRHLNNRSA